MPGSKRKRNEKSGQKNAIGGGAAETEKALAAELFGLAATATGASAPQKRRKTEPRISNDDVEDSQEDAGDAWTDAADDGAVVDLARTARTRKLRSREEETTVSKAHFEKKLREFHVKSVSSSNDWAKVDEEGTARVGAPSGDAWGSEADQADSAAFGGVKSTASQIKEVASTGVDEASKLRATRLKDANASDYHRSVVSSIGFHSSGRLLLSSGLDCSLKFFKVEGSACEKAHSVSIPGFPVSRAQFIAGDKVLAFGRRPFFYAYDVPSGRSTRMTLHGRHERSWTRAAVASGASSPFAAALLGDAGSVLLLDSRTHRVAHELKVDGDAWCADFDPTGTSLVVGSSLGQLSLYDVRTLRTVAAHRDEGSAGVTCVACSGSGYAAGAASGVANFYEAPSSAAGPSLTATAASSSSGASAAASSSSSSSSFFAPRAGDAAASPAYTTMNLTTRLEGISYSAAGRMAAVWSKEQKDQLRVVNLQARAVYANWPTSRTPLSHVQCAAFAPDDSMVAIGNDKGRVLLYALD